MKPQLIVTVSSGAAARFHVWDWTISHYDANIYPSRSSVMRKATLGLAIFVLFATDFGLLAAQKEGEKPRDEQPKKLELPWTLEAVKKAWKNGLTIKYESRSATTQDGSGRESTFMFEQVISEVTDKGFKLTKTDLLEGDKRGESTVEEKTWENWTAGFVFTDKDTKVTDEQVATYSDIFKCRVYTTNAEEEKHKHSAAYYFIQDKPGVLCKFTDKHIYEKSQTVETLELRYLKVGTGFKAPFTLDEARKTYQKGMKLKYRHSYKSNTSEFEFILLREVKETGEEGITFVVTTTTEKRAGKKLPKPEVTQQEVFTRWAELDYQKNFDNDKSSRADEDHKIPAGKFMCLLYTVSISDDRASKSAKAWYIKEKPGVLAEYEEVLVVASAGTKEKDTQTTHFVLEDLKTK